VPFFKVAPFDFIIELTEREREREREREMQTKSVSCCSQKDCTPPCNRLIKFVLRIKLFNLMEESMHENKQKRVV
jgi:hypothetical protein